MTARSYVGCAGMTVEPGDGGGGTMGISDYR